MNIQYKLDDQIHQSCFKGNIEPRLIAMNPQTWKNLIEDLRLSEVFKYIIYQGKELKYKGINVIRSYDVEIGEFLIL